MNLSDAIRDSDGDGYNDKLEYDRRNAGFDPGDAQVPAKQCIDRQDLDGDGLLGCEETVLGTNSKATDSDRDRIPDGLEFIWGTDPLTDDSKTDIDFDTKLSGDEIAIHSDPKIADPEIHAEYRYVYNVKEQPERIDLRQCYTFRVSNIRLVTTAGQAAGSQGMNEVLVYFGEGPADDPRDFGSFKAACIRAQYVEPAFKDPADGKMTLTPDDFRDVAGLLRLMADAKATLDPSIDPCVGAALR